MNSLFLENESLYQNYPPLPLPNPNIYDKLFNLELFVQKLEQRIEVLEKNA